jgi:ERCC4-type nuclease
MPFTVIVDSREQEPFRFSGIIGDSAEQFRRLVVPTQVACLATGDYSIAGTDTHGICIERKSAADLFSTLAAGRDRFEEEHKRMQCFQTKAVVIEADWTTMLLDPPGHSRLSPLSVYGTAISWLVKYNVPWIACPGRRFAEMTTFKILRKFYEHQQHGIVSSAPTL